MRFLSLSSFGIAILLLFTVVLLINNSEPDRRKIKVDPEYARVALRKYGERIVREQVNLDNVAQVAAEEIHDKVISSGGEQETQQEVQEISDDWLNQFEKEASQKSSEEMQLLFGRILAGEIQRPSVISTRI